MGEQPIKEETFHLNKTLELLKTYFKSLETQVSELKTAYEEGLKDVATELRLDDRVSALSGLNKMMKNKGYTYKVRHIERFKNQIRNPYFARIDFKENQIPQAESFYLGRFSFIPEDRTNAPYRIVDWRTPVASLFYNYNSPTKEVSYEVPINKEMPWLMDKDAKITGELILRRNIDIESEKIIGVYDNNLKVDLLSQAIKERSGGVLEDIIETIVAIQNQIIRCSPEKVCVVQGAAGSGKTTIAIHRISYLFYTYKNQIKENNTLLLTSSKVLVNYVSKSLPELEVYEVAKGTLQSYISKKLGIETEKVRDQRNEKISKVLNSKEFRDSLVNYCQKFKKDLLENLFKNEGFATLNIASINRLETMETFDYMENMVADLAEDIKSYREEEKKGNYFAYQKLKTATKLISLIRRSLKDFKVLEEYNKFAILNDIPFEKEKIDSDSLSAIYCMYSLITGKKVLEDDNFAHIVIDEAQDLSLINFWAIKLMGTGNGFTVLGDLNQAINDDLGIKKWEDLQQIFGNEDMEYFEIKESYRTTKELMIYAKKILQKFPKVFVNLPEPFRRSGNTPILRKFENGDELVGGVVREIKEVRKRKDFNSVGIIIENSEYMELFESSLSAEGLKYLIVDKNFDSFSKTAIYLVPENLIKGLEFDTVFIIDPNEKILPFSPLSAKRLFVECTRAINNLYIYHLGNLNSLLG